MDTVPQKMNVKIRRDNTEYNVDMHYFVTDHDCNAGTLDVICRFEHPVTKEQMQSKQRRSEGEYSNEMKALEDAVIMTEQLCGHTNQ